MTNRIIRSSSLKNEIEKIHLDYLCDHFRLMRNPSTKTGSYGTGPDLIGIDEPPRQYFEMKSRSYPKEQSGTSKRHQSQFEWWTMLEEQILRYEKFAESEGVSICLLLPVGHMERLVTDTEGLCEDSVLWRDIFVVPWKAHELVNVTATGKKYLGLARLKRTYDFKRTPVEKGELFIAEKILFDVEDYFRQD
jgi:hypothetical protein